MWLLVIDTCLYDLHTTFLSCSSSSKIVESWREKYCLSDASKLSPWARTPVYMTYILHSCPAQVPVRSYEQFRWHQPSLWDNHKANNDTYRSITETFSYLLTRKGQNLFFKTYYLIWYTTATKWYNLLNNQTSTFYLY